MSGNWGMAIGGLLGWGVAGAGIVYVSDHLRGSDRSENSTCAFRHALLLLDLAHFRQVEGQHQELTLPFQRPRSYVHDATAD